MRCFHVRYRSRSFVMALFLLVVAAQQLGVFAHTGMLARAALGAAMRGDVCTSADSTYGQGTADPSKSPARADGACGLCAAATMAQLAGGPSLLAAAGAAVHDVPSLAAIIALPARPWRHKLSRAPPESLLT